MMKTKAIFILCGLLSVSALFSQQAITLKKIYSTGQHYDVDFPVVLDSVNIRGEKFENKNILESFISFPDKSAFKDQLSSDISGYFTLSKAQRGARFHLLSFDLNVDRYAKTNVRISAPGMFEAYINDVKEATKTSVEDTLTSSKTVKMNFPSQPGTYSILIKYMSLSTNKSPEGLKITIEPEDKNSQVNYTFGEAGKRNVTIKDILEGKRVSGVSISPNGQYILLTYTTTKNDGKTFTEKELFSQRTSRRIALSADKNYRWMPASDRLYYTDDASGKVKLVTVEPESLQENILAENIPSGNFVFTPDEKILIYTEKESPDAGKSDLMLLTAPEDRQPNNKDRYYLSKYTLASGVKQRLTFGNKSTRLNDISKDSGYILYSVRENIPTERPFLT